MSIKKGKKTLFSEINITPLTDIFLVLLIIMMVIAPSFQSIDNSITVPEVNSGTSIEQGKVTVSVTKDGTIYIDGKKTSIGMLSTDLEALKQDKDNAEVVVKADEKVKSSIILEIMDAAQDAHYKKLIVAGEPLNKKEQKALEEGVNQGANQGVSQGVNNDAASNTLSGASTAIPGDNQYENWSE